MASPGPHQFRIATPCPARWEEMTGDERTRFCGQCKKHVYNLESMTRAQVTELVARTQGSFCGRFYERADGTALADGDCPVALAALRRRAHRAYARIAAVILAAACSLAGGIAIARAVQDPDAARKSPAIAWLKDKMDRVGHWIDPPPPPEQERFLVGRVGPLVPRSGKPGVVTQEE